MKTSLPALFAGLAAASIWGGMYVVSKVVLEVIPPFALLSLRLLLGFATLAIVVLFRGGFKMEKWQVAVSIAVGFVGYAVSLGFQFVGTKLSTASNGALVTSATPVLVLPFALLLLREKLGVRRLIAVAVACAGVIAVIAPWNASAPAAAVASVSAAGLLSAGSLGNLCLVAAAVTWALYSVLVRKISAKIDVLESSAIMLLGGVPTSVAFGVAEISANGVGPIGPGIVAGVLFLGIVSTAIAMFLWNYSFAKLPAATASLTFFAQPVVGTLLGWAFLGDTITPLFLAGGALIGAGIFIARE
ncbi:MAG: DMT family transporter [Treponemataceae bacterium]